MESQRRTRPTLHPMLLAALAAFSLPAPAPASPSDPVLAATESSIDYIHLDGFEPGADCSAELPCPTPSAGKSCLSGRLVTAASGTPVRAFLNAQAACGAGAVGGPCDLSLTAYDATAFAQNPLAAPPLASTEKLVDGCGRFRIANFDPPLFGFVAVLVDDADPAPESDRHAPTATPRALAANAKLDGARVLVTRTETVAGWTQTAGNPFGANGFVAEGSVLLQFRAAGTPRAGVAVTANGSAVSTKDYYFSDVGPADRVTVDASLATTGANGAVLVVNSGFVSYSGFGGEPMGCTWPASMTSSIPGVLVYVEIDC